MTLNSSHDNQTQPTPQPGPTKKPYRVPVLEQYGDLRDLTMGIIQARRRGQQESHA